MTKTKKNVQKKRRRLQKKTRVVKVSVVLTDAINANPKDAKTNLEGVNIMQ
jgi:hypothetical protein